MKIQEIISETPIIGADYFRGPLTRRGMDAIIRWFKKKVDISKFDLIVGTGLSGAAAIPVLARELDKRFVLVRKRQGHSDTLSGGNIRKNDRWIFVDDFIYTQRTLNKTKRIIEKEFNNAENFNLRYVGSVEYETRTVSQNLKK